MGGAEAISPAGMAAKALVHSAKASFCMSHHSARTSPAARRPFAEFPGQQPSPVKPLRHTDRPGIDSHAAPMMMAKIADPFRSSGCVMPLRPLVEVSV
jgi:hypothetical protein